MTSRKLSLTLIFGIFLLILGCIQTEHPDPDSLRPAAERGDWQTVCKTYQYLLKKEIGSHFPGGTGYVYRGNWLKYSTNQRFIPTDKIAFEILKIWWNKRYNQQKEINAGQIIDSTTELIFAHPLPDIESDFDNFLPEYLKEPENVLIYDEPTRNRITSETPILLALHRVFFHRVLTPDETAKTFMNYFKTWELILDEIIVKNIAGVNNKLKLQIIFEIKLLLIKLGIEIYWWLPAESISNQQIIMKVLHESGLITKEYKLTGASVKIELKDNLLKLFDAVQKYHRIYTSKNLITPEKPLFSLVWLAELKNLKFAMNEDEAAITEPKINDPQTQPAEPQTQPE